MHQQQHEYREIFNALTVFTSPGQVFEIRLLHHQNKRRIDAGYFDRPEEAATAIAALQDHYSGIYYTPNPVNPDLAARYYNRIHAWADRTTLDTDILRRRWILVDIDPDRPSGISSTDAELSNAFKVITTIANSLELEGFPQPYINISGNGCHAYYPIDEDNTDEVRDTIHNFLKILNGRFKAFNCSVDTTTFNASRIFRLPGTWARKGDNVPSRPHRKSYMVSAPPSRVNVPILAVRRFNEANVKFLGNVVPLKVQARGAEYPADEAMYRALNAKALDNVKEWVPVLFPAARPYKEGFRIASADLGLNYEEDLAIHPWPLGIKYFGTADQNDPTDGRRTAVSLVAEFVTEGDKFKAATRLASTLKMAATEFDILSQPVGLNGHGVDGLNGHANLPGTVASGIKFDFSNMPNAASLKQKDIQEAKWIVPGLLPVGAILLASRPKMRKTWLALQLAISVVGGTRFLGYAVNQGEVLFLGLEDNERRLKQRIALLQTWDLNPPDMSKFRYFTAGVDIRPNGHQYVSDNDEHARAYAAFPRGDAGIDALEAYLDTYPLTKLIVIDTYACFRDSSSNRDVYQRDYDQMTPITQLCARRQVCALVVHHEKKGLAGIQSGDFMEDVSGSTGITGAADGVMSIKGVRGPTTENEARILQVSGRDIPELNAIHMKFDAERGGWLTTMRQDVRAEILKLLTRSPYRVLLTDICNLVQGETKDIKKALSDLRTEGLIDMSRDGYQLMNNFKEE